LRLSSSALDMEQVSERLDFGVLDVANKGFTLKVLFVENSSTFQLHFQV
jgi:hypothetical protein